MVEICQGSEELATEHCQRDLSVPNKRKWQNWSNRKQVMISLNKKKERSSYLAVKRGRGVNGVLGATGNVGGKKPNGRSKW